MAKKSEAKRQAILNAALEEFESKGFAGALVEDIARKAGVSKGTIYGYFESKDAILLGLAEEVGGWIRRSLYEWLRCPDMPIAEKIWRSTQVVLEDNGQGRLPRIFRAIWSEGLHRPELTKPVFERFIVPALSPESPLVKAIEDSNADPFIKRYPMAVMAPFLQGVLWTGLIQDVKPIDLREYFREYLVFIFGEFNADGIGTDGRNLPMPLPEADLAAEAPEAASAEKPPRRRTGTKKSKAGS